MRRHLLRLCLVAACLGAGGFLALGLPGGVVLVSAVALAGLVGDAKLEGDAVWPTALVISLLGPFAILPADLAAMRVARSRGGRVLLTAALALAIVVVATGAGLLLFR